MAEPAKVVVEIKEESTRELLVGDDDSGAKRIVPIMPLMSAILDSLQHRVLLAIARQQIDELQELLVYDSIATREMMQAGVLLPRKLEDGRDCELWLLYKEHGMEPPARASLYEHVLAPLLASTCRHTDMPDTLVFVIGAAAEVARCDYLFSDTAQPLGGMMFRSQAQLPAGAHRPWPSYGMPPLAMIFAMGINTVLRQTAPRHMEAMISLMQQALEGVYGRTVDVLEGTVLLGRLLADCNASEEDKLQCLFSMVASVPHRAVLFASAMICGAVRRNHLRLLHTLVVDMPQTVVDMPDEHGCTPMYYAVTMHGRAAALEILAQNDASLLLINDQGDNIIHKEVYSKQMNVWMHERIAAYTKAQQMCHKGMVLRLAQDLRNEAMKTIQWQEQPRAPQLLHFLDMYVPVSDEEIEKEMQRCAQVQQQEAAAAADASSSSSSSAAPAPIPLPIDPQGAEGQRALEDMGVVPHMTLEGAHSKNVYHQRVVDPTNMWITSAVKLDDMIHGRLLQLQMMITAPRMQCIELPSTAILTLLGSGRPEDPFLPGFEGASITIRLFDLCVSKGIVDAGSGKGEDNYEQLSIAPGTRLLRNSVPSTRVVFQLPYADADPADPQDADFTCVNYHGTTAAEWVVHPMVSIACSCIPFELFDEKQLQGGRDVPAGAGDKGDREAELGEGAAPAAPIAPGPATPVRIALTNISLTVGATLMRRADLQVMLDNSAQEMDVRRELGIARAKAERERQAAEAAAAASEETDEEEEDDSEVLVDE